MSVMATGTVDGADEKLLAGDMLDVHGPKAAAVARDNARAAALAGQRQLAKFWIRVLGLIQQRETEKTSDSWSGANDPRQVQLKDN